MKVAYYDCGKHDKTVTIGNVEIIDDAEAGSKSGNQFQEMNASDMTKLIEMNAPDIESNALDAKVVELFNLCFYCGCTNPYPELCLDCQNLYFHHECQIKYDGSHYGNQFALKIGIFRVELKVERG